MNELPITMRDPHEPQDPKKPAMGQSVKSNTGCFSVPSSGGTTVQVRELVKRYERGRIIALNGVELDVRGGEFVAICGPSGCGKSTLLNILSAIDRPDEGCVVIDGRPLLSLSEAQANRYRSCVVGLVFQLHNLLPNLTALENVQVPMLRVETNAAARVARARVLLDRVGLTQRASALPPTLSGGERQRVAVARALANSPRLLLADEPTGSLDSTNGDNLIDLLCGLQRDLSTTLVMVTHNESLAGRADRIVQMLDGRIVKNTDPRQIPATLPQGEDR